MNESNIERTKGLWIFTVVLLLVIFSYIIGKWTPYEDAYISFRYAANIAKGYGIVFNPNERVEGFTNLLWVLLLAVPGLLKTSFIPYFSLILQFIFTLGTLAILYFWTRKRWPLLVLIISPGFVDNLGPGMETMLLTFLILAAIYCLYVKNNFILGSTLFGLAFMTRPDALVLVAPLSFGAIIKQKYEIRTIAQIIAPMFFIGVGLELFRYFYFSSLVPNTAYCKLGIDLISNCKLGLVSLSRYLLNGGFVLLIYMLFIILKIPKKPLALFLGLMAVIQICYYIAVGGPSGNDSRFLTPILPLVIVAIAQYDLSRKSLSMISLVAIAGFAVFLFSINPMEIHFPKMKKVGYFTIISKAVHSLPAGSTVLFQGLGLVGWDNQHLVLYDPLGLIDADVAKNGIARPEIMKQGHRKWMTADQFFQKKPDYYIPFVRGSVIFGPCTEYPSYVFKSVDGPDSEIFKDDRLLEIYVPTSLTAPGLGCTIAFQKKNPVN